jgi:hypothetical protein
MVDAVLLVAGDGDHRARDLVLVRAQPADRQALAGEFLDDAEPVAEVLDTEEPASGVCPI